MKTLLPIYLIFLLTASCSIYPQKGTRWPSSFYRAKRPCKGLISELATATKKRKIIHSSQKSNILHLLKTGQLVHDESNSL